MSDIASLDETLPFGLGAPEKSALFTRELNALTRHHRANCPPYARMLDALGIDTAIDQAVADLPFVPVRLFKEFDLKSIADGDVLKTMTSSGTSGQNVSRIYLDKMTAAAQTKALTRIVSDFFGPKRLPMLVVDCPSVIKSRANFSARGAGILGFSIFGRNVTYALDDDMRLDEPTISLFLEKHAGSPILLFGFTFMVFEYLVEALRLSGRRLALNDSILIHGGGWKKLADKAVDNDTFKTRLADVTDIRRVHNYYGMIEQTGSVFMECEHGRLHASVYSDVLIRKADFSVAAPEEEGLIELVSLLPGSYPGHIILSEDLGRVTGEDDCPCGRLGKTFAVHGRAHMAEARGCSDTFHAA